MPYWYKSRPDSDQAVFATCGSTSMLLDSGTLKCTKARPPILGG
jgi:hypothetical protein